VNTYRHHKLMTVPIREALPPLYANEELEDAGEALCVVKYFSPYAQHRWYITEWDGTDIMFGFAVAPEAEWGYVSLSELEAAAGMNGRLPLVERDIHFEPKSVREAYRADYGKDMP
jgi:hypothetical protein